MARLAPTHQVRAHRQAEGREDHRSGHPAGAAVTSTARSVP